MNWTTETRYKILLEINNAVATRRNRDELFQALARELQRHFAYDRLSIILYDQGTESIGYFAAADGVQPSGNVARKSRPLADGAIAKMVIHSRQPAIFDDLTRYTDLRSIGELVEAGLTSTMAFPMIIRDQVLGTINFSFREAPTNISELAEVLKDVSLQIAIAVSNMLSYRELQRSNRQLEEEKQFLLSSGREYQEGGFFFSSQAMNRIMGIIDQVADSDETVLLTGETGTGKDFLARLIHDKSKRKDNLFVKANCPGLTSSLFESELFGHSKGAFTGADSKRLGRFELADRGTIFLDEIGDLPLEQQAKLLQVLQERKFERVGESTPISVDARVIAATNKDLLLGVQNGSFRQDLFYRLETVTVQVPPLRERSEDIPLLVDNINRGESERMNRVAPIYSDEAIELLRGYAWPGNVRELKNLVKRLIILNPGSRVDRAAIQQIIPTSIQQSAQSRGIATREEAERDHIIKALTTCRGMVGGKRGAAELLGMARSTLQYRMKKLGIEPVEYQGG